MLALFLCDLLQQLRRWLVFRILRHEATLDGEGEDGLAQGGDVFWCGGELREFTQDEGGVAVEVVLFLPCGSGRESAETLFRLCFSQSRLTSAATGSGGEAVERGADEAGAVFARGGLSRLQFVAQRQQLPHLRHNAALFLRRWNWNRAFPEF